ncbi:hypothetical protein CY34DRAFT_800308 [Suillus luteus UH-Slu-Lm8-n1]|uniref:Uncharacterized protein n=1 Tax=Suillus luteus UH-Slu-Lm8-n1 TaxID=930992 RepID=A0A0D0BKX2_9AGAM|nr:hypothetical protein CY34DRAFT_800308 [Suillus luteus UH-Slu-Lm8-n1]
MPLVDYRVLSREPYNRRSDLWPVCGLWFASLISDSELWSLQTDNLTSPVLSCEVTVLGTRTGKG